MWPAKSKVFATDYFIKTLSGALLWVGQKINRQSVKEEACGGAKGSDGKALGDAIS